MIQYIIDGNNIIGKIPELFKLQKKDKQRSREQLVYLLQRYYSGKKIHLSLYFDGFENIPLHMSKGKIIYSGNKQADHFIREQIEKTKNRKNVVLVSSDNELKNFGRACSCRIISSEDFVKLLMKGKTEDEEKLRVEDINDVEEWKRIFLKK